MFHTHAHTLLHTDDCRGTLETAILPQFLHFVRKWLPPTLVLGESLDLLHSVPLAEAPQPSHGFASPGWRLKGPGEAPGHPDGSAL